MTGQPRDDLRSINDEILYVRLLKSNERFPRDFDATDYDRRRDAWEAGHSAIRAEIQRRGARPPAWWKAANGDFGPPPRRRRRSGVAVGIIAYVAICAAAIVAFGGPAFAVVFWVTVLGGGLALFVASQVSSHRTTRRR